VLCYALAQKKRKNSSTLVQVFFVLKNWYKSMFCICFFRAKKRRVEKCVGDFCLFAKIFSFIAQRLFTTYAFNSCLSLSLCMFCFCLLLLLFATKFYSPFTAITLNLIYSRKISEAPLRRSRRTSPRFFARARTFPFSYRTPWRVRFSRRESRCERGFYPP
jgi:hypothetical protein